MEGRRAESGQATVEWIGVTLLLALLSTAIATTGVRVPAASVAHAVAVRMLCAASLSRECDAEPPLEATYGDEIASLVREHAPTLMLGPGLLGLPVDFRTCRSPYCADAPGLGEVTESTAGEPVTLFTRVVDCRRGHAAGAGCGSAEVGALFIQYWAYYPESASLRGVPILERKGYHRHDWESLQLRIDGSGNAEGRASSHSGYNHGRSPANWGSDAGWGILRRAAEAAGLRRRGGWGEATGRYLIAGGSHAGNLRDPGGAYPSWAPASEVRLVPLEAVKGGPLARPARFDPITPPWRKRVWRDPDAEGTG